MSRENPDANPGSPAGARQYQVLCLLALALVFLADMNQGNVILSMFLLMVGMLGVVVRLRMGPILFLAVAAGSQFSWLRQRGLAPVRGGGSETDLVFSMGVLAYVVAHYRWQGLVHNILPPDPRRRTGPRRWLFLAGRIVLQARPESLVSAKEIGWFLMGLPIWAVLGWGMWELLRPARLLLDLPVGLVRLLNFGWALVLGILVTCTLVDRWRRRRASPEVAALYLQDVLWRETRREQRRLNRWTAWWRIKKK